MHYLICWRHPCQQSGLRQVCAELGLVDIGCAIQLNPFSLVCSLHSALRWSTRVTTLRTGRTRSLSALNLESDRWPKLRRLFGAQGRSAHRRVLHWLVGGASTDQYILHGDSKICRGKAKIRAGIQRERSPKRIGELSEYVNFDYATFPTSVVLALDERSVAIYPVANCSGLYVMEISDFGGDDGTPLIPLAQSAFIIDGQHRLAGLEALQGDKTFDVNVSIFVGADLADKAEIFSRVNLAQTKVNRSLVYDLFSYAEKRSPHKFSHEVTIALNRDNRGPSFGKIKRLGKATPGLGKTSETLSQATVVDGILQYISGSIQQERNRGFLGLPSPRRRADEWRRYIFQSFFCTIRKSRCLFSR